LNRIFKLENKMVKELTTKKKDRRMLTLFFCIVPSLLLAMTASIDSFYIRIFFQVVLIFFQIIIFKSFIDDFYGYPDEAE